MSRLAAHPKAGMAAGYRRDSFSCGTSRWPARKQLAWAIEDTTRTHLVPVSVHYFLQVTSYEGRVRWEHKLYTTRGREYTRRRDQRWIVEEMAPPRSCANDLPQACCNAGPGFGAEVGCIRSQRTSVFLQVALFRESEGRTLLICLLSNSHARSQSSQF